MSDFDTSYLLVLYLIFCLPIALAVDVVVSTVVLSVDGYNIIRGITAAARVIIVIINVNILLPIFFTLSFLSKKWNRFVNLMVTSSTL